MSASQRWADQLAAWAIDPEILAAAPESPYGLPPELFRAGGAAPSPLLDLARDALPDGGSVLDVGCGAGAASLPLSPGLLVAVDSQPSMLDALRAAAADAGVPVTAYEGTWPDVAPEVPVCDVVVCAHVAYNVPDLGEFATALHDHARRRVLLELSDRHPWVGMGPLWEHFHHQPRPDGPTAELAEAVLREHGIIPRAVRWTRPAVALDGPLRPAYVAFTRRRLCLPLEREPEVAALLDAHPPGARESVVLWWDR